MNRLLFSVNSNLNEKAYGKTATLTRGSTLTIELTAYRSAIICTAVSANVSAEKLEGCYAVIAKRKGVKPAVIPLSNADNISYTVADRSITMINNNTTYDAHVDIISNGAVIVTN